MTKLTFLKEWMSKKTRECNSYASKECDICYYWYFLNHSFKFQSTVYNRCHDLLMMSINPSDTTILNIEGSDYCCIINLVSKNEAINILKKADLTEKNGTSRKNREL